MTLLGLSACTVTREQPKLVGQDVRVTLLHTSDMHSRILPYHMVPNRFDREYGLLPENAPFGGAARMATIIKRERERANRSLWLDSGDWFQGAPIFNLYRGEAEVRALSAMGLDGSVIGNHEFDQGAQNAFVQIASWAEYSVLAANYLWDEPANPQQHTLRDVVKPFQIFDVDGLRVGVIGMASWSSMVGIFEGGNSLGVRPRDDAEVVTEYVRLLRPAVDLIVLSSHLGLHEDQGLGEDAEYDDSLEGIGIGTVPLAGVDVILGGHLHIVLNPPKVIPNDDHGNQTVLVHSGAFAKYVGRLDLVVRVGDDQTDPQRRSYVTAFSYDNIPVDSTIPPDPAITELLWPYSMELHRQLNLGGVFAYVDGEENINRKDLSGGDSQLGNMVARAMQLRRGIEAELTITNSLGIRTDVFPGPLTIEQMYNVFPFENTIAVMYVSGTELQETLDFVSRKSANRGCQSQAQVAGISFDMVCNGDCPNGKTACAKNIYLGDDCRGGNPNGEIDPTACPPVIPEGLYRIATNDYLARGGSGFDVFKRNSSKQITEISLRDALITFLRTQPSCANDVLDISDPERNSVSSRWGKVACLDNTIEPHNGRIRAVFE